MLQTYPVLIQPLPTSVNYEAFTINFLIHLCCHTALREYMPCSGAVTNLYLCSDMCYMTKTCDMWTFRWQWHEIQI